MKYTFNQDQIYTITNALRLAADKYDDNARLMSLEPPMPKLVELFKEQHKVALDLADQLEEASSLQMTFEIASADPEAAI